MTGSSTDLPAPLSSASVTAGPLPPSSCASHLDSEICSCNFSGESSPFLAWSWFLEEQQGKRWILRILLFSDLSLQYTHTHTRGGGAREMVISFMYWEGRKSAHYTGSEDNLQESALFFHHDGLEEGIYTAKFGSRYLTPQFISPALPYFQKHY